MSRFVDRVVIHVAGGAGGNGCASVHREKFKPLGGPDGGNGGRGGDVVLVVDSSVHTLLDFHFRPHARATNGKIGMGSNRDGAQGEDLILKVPDGTVVLDEQGEVLADLVGVGTTLVAAEGGRGGLGNAALASRARRAPGFALLGEPGTEVKFPVLLVVDGTNVTADADALGKASVTGTVVEHTKGRKIRIHKFKNKTGYHKRQGHRQKLTRVEVTGISK